MATREIVPHKISDRFWGLLETGRRDREAFESEAGSMSEDELYRFYWTYRYAMGVLKMSPYVDFLDPELSGDSTEDVCMWIVAQGKDYFLSIIDDPKKMPFDVDDPNPDCIYLNIITRAYLQRTGTFPDYPDGRDFSFG